MPNQNQNAQIWNQGRVVGYSAYEVYVKQHISENDPADSPPASEREWLASSLATGVSMLVKIPVDTVEGSHYIDIQFPTNTALCAANTIIASIFIGDAQFASNGWATKITDYGYLISNNSISSPANGDIGPTGDIPTQTIDDWPKEKRDQLREYMKVIDGIIIQPGTWSDNGSKPPQKDFAPNIGSYPRLRLFLSDKIETEFSILLTGFSLRAVVQGTTGLDTSINTEHPQNGDFLGPATYPWSNKVIFCVPTAFINYFMFDKYHRKIPMDGEELKVDETAIIDMKSTDPGSYYIDNHTNSSIDYEVTAISGDSSILTVYQRDKIFPPALYGTLTDDVGNSKLNPIDTTAPGTIKLFPDDDGTKGTQFETNIPNNYAFMRGNDYVVKQIDDTQSVVPVSDDTIDNAGDDTNTVYRSIGTSGKHITKSVSLTDPSGLDLSLTGSSGIITLSNATDNLTWQQLLAALGTDKSLNILGEELQEIKQQLINISQTAGSTDQYVIVWDGDKFVIQKFSSEFPNFFINFLGCLGNNNGSYSTDVNPYNRIYINIFGFASYTPESSGGATTVGSITLRSNGWGPEHIGGIPGNPTKNWFQNFECDAASLPKATELARSLVSLMPDDPSEENHINCLKLSIVPVAGYTTNSTNYGAPSSADYTKITCYMQVTDKRPVSDWTNMDYVSATGKGILYVRPRPGTAYVASGSYSCSIGATSENSPGPAYGRSGWEWSDQ